MGLFWNRQQMQITDSILPLAAKQEIIACRLPQLNSVCFQFKKVLKYKHLRLICDIIGAKKQRVNAQKPCT